MGLKEATFDKHKEAETMEFNQRMMNGELSDKEYVRYLKGQLAIFSALENKPQFPHDGLRRKEVVKLDVEELAPDGFHAPSGAVMAYVDYLNSLDFDDEVLPHIYLNYLALFYGGQMIKRNTPGTGRMYDFNDAAKSELISVIRASQKDEWADEVNRGFEFIINIFRELQEVSDAIANRPKSPAER